MEHVLKIGMKFAGFFANIVAYKECIKVRLQMYAPQVVKNVI